MTTPQAQSVIYIVDDDEAVRDSLRWLLRPMATASNATRAPNSSWRPTTLSKWAY